MNDTIFALSSGSPPAAIAVVRVSGPQAADAVAALAGSLPEPRKASYRILRGPDRDVLDRALVLWFPGPATATGEDLAELHLHGGRAVVAAIELALANRPKLRRATPGEFTRRAFANGRIDLAEAEGLADLLTAETELQRRNAIAIAGGELSAKVEDWRSRVLLASAQVESVLDFADEDDVAQLPGDFGARLAALRSEISEWLARPRVELLRDGFRVVLAGPPNAGKSTLFNALVKDEAAITAAVAGTTRDVLTRSVAIEGIPLVFVDTAGLREEVDNEIEAIGISRALDAVENADLVLWLGPEGEGPAGSWDIAAQADIYPDAKPNARQHVSAVTGQGVAALSAAIVAAARTALPKPGTVALNQRQHSFLAQADAALADASHHEDPLIIAEALRMARVAFDAIGGRTTTEDMLDALFGRFCIGK